MRERDFRILIVDDVKAVLSSFDLILGSKYKLFFAQDAESALSVIEENHIHLAFVDIDLPGRDGFYVLQKIKDFDRAIQVIMVTGDNSTKTVVKAMKMGAIDYITKPFNVDELEPLTEKVFQEASKIQEDALEKTSLPDSALVEIIGKSEPICRIRNLTKKIAKVNTTALITGASGTGKELVARAIYENSGLEPEPFIAINCGAIPDLLLESELFGHEKGAFTGAYKRRIGKFELAGSGIIFLDEISNMPDVLQAKLLRVLQEREIERVGGNQLIKINARIIAATNVDLKQKITEGSFREDLYYRLNVIRIHIPPLRERRADIELLINYYLEYYNQKFNTHLREVTPDAMRLLEEYSWPGNVRELSNLMERLVLLSTGDVIAEYDLPRELTHPNEKHELYEEGEDPSSFKTQRNQFEREMIIRILKKVKFNQSQAARQLNIHRNTLLAKLNQLDIDVQALKQQELEQYSS